MLAFIDIFIVDIQFEPAEQPCSQIEYEHSEKGENGSDDRMQDSEHNRQDNKNIHSERRYFFRHEVARDGWKNHDHERNKQANGKPEYPGDGSADLERRQNADTVDLPACEHDQFVPDAENTKYTLFFKYSTIR